VDVLLESMVEIFIVIAEFIRSASISCNIAGTKLIQNLA
jgi:hypothetical protein